MTYLLTAGGLTYTEEAPNLQVQELLLYGQEICKKVKEEVLYF